MGGGDLNLKKSWHPSTFANLEKVWKAEQKHESEQKKIAQLQQELKEERSREEMQRAAIDAGVVKKRDARVDWLYSGPASSVDREEYLLGKKIDKLIDPTLVEEEREKEALASGPGALFVGGGSSGANSTTDLAMKVREDPLFLIKQKEEEAKKKLASNPIKLRQLQQLLAAEGKTSKSKKKKHKRSREQHSDSESPPPSRRARSDCSPSPPESRSHQHHHHTHHHHHHQDRTESSHKRSAHHSPPTRPSSKYRQPHSKLRSRTKGMDPEELERRRQEMMADAKEHDRNRERRLRQHEQEQQKMEELAKTVKSGDFLQSMRVKSLSSSNSLSDRIHRNINSVQRTSAKLDSNFMSK